MKIIATKNETIIASIVISVLLALNIVILLALVIDYTTTPLEESFIGMICYWIVQSLFEEVDIDGED